MRLSPQLKDVRRTDTPDFEMKSGDMSSLKKQENSIPPKRGTLE